MMRSRAALLGWLLRAGLVAVGGLSCNKGPTALDPDADLRVLFVGNSLTAGNDLPAMTRAVAASGGWTLSYAVRVAPNVSLEDHWYSGVAEEIARLRADVVVLQQGPSSLPANQQHLRHWSEVLAGPIRDAGGTPALFMVWPDASRESAFDDVYAAYHGAAQAVDGLFIPAGDAWRAVWRRDPDASLYGADGFHPSRLGSLVAAITIYAVLFDVDVRGLPASVAPELSAARSELLLEAVHEAVLAAQDGGATFTFTDLAPGVLAALVVPDPPNYAFANSLVVDLGGELLVVDTQQSPAAAEALIDEIRARWTEPVRWVVNTHWHGDHVYGNIAYRRMWPDVIFVGHHTLADDMRDLGLPQLEQDRAALPPSIEERRRWLAAGTGPDGTPLTAAQRTRVQRSLDLRVGQVEQLRTLELVPPDSVFTDSIVLAGSTRTVRLYAVGPAHTRGDVVVWLEAEGILAAGDLVEDAYPWVDGGDIGGWARALERLATFGASVILPAHGSPWHAPAARLETQKALFLAAHQAGCVDGATAPPELASFRQAHGLADGEAERRFWVGLVAATLDRPECRDR